MFNVNVIWAIFGTYHFSHIDTLVSWELVHFQSRLICKTFGQCCHIRVLSELGEKLSIFTNSTKKCVHSFLTKTPKHLHLTCTTSQPKPQCFDNAIVFSCYYKAPCSRPRSGVTGKINKNFWRKGARGDRVLPKQNESLIIDLPIKRWIVSQFAIVFEKITSNSFFAQILDFPENSLARLGLKKLSAPAKMFSHSVRTIVFT